MKCNVLSAILIGTLAIAGCMSPAGARNSVDSQTQSLEDKVDWMKSSGMNYGSKGVPAIQFKSRGGPIFPSALN